jgi:hypothetical protein
MPLRFWNERDCAVVVFEGTYDAQKALDMIDEALNASPPAKGLLLDLSESVSFRRRSADDLRHIASFLSDRRERFGSRVATVASTDLAYGLLRMSTVFVTERGLTNEAFRTRTEAIDWLCGCE